MPVALPRRWDLFCTVIDNFGDIGVCWRLARQLVEEHGLTVRLWLDDVASLQRIWPTASLAARQHLEGVTVCRWSAKEIGAALRDAGVADVVVEAFGCQLPLAYLNAMAQRNRPPVWVNLEYLTAEAWAVGCHGLASARAFGELDRHFYFPGFGDRSGGLLHEQGLLTRRDAFTGSRRKAFLHRIGVPCDEGERLISLFSYETPALRSALDAVAATAERWRWLVAPGRGATAMAAALDVSELEPGKTIVHRTSTVQLVPFLRQDDYDKLLWSCHFNIVRGEDSFVRAQWAGKPMLWHIYPQAEGAHWPKLDAFLDRYTVGLPDAVAAAVRRTWRHWNAGEPTRGLDQLLANDLSALARHAVAWSAARAEDQGLAAGLVEFCAKRA